LGAAACRFCGELLSDTVIDLGMSPLCESYLRPDQLNAMEASYPLHVTCAVDVDWSRSSST
jgi:hypothetical protein